MTALRTWLLILILALPLAGVLGLTALKEMDIKNSTSIVVPIKGYDPRDLMYGHYLRFRLDSAEFPANENYSYYIPEKEAPDLDRLLREGKVEMSVTVYKRKDGKLNFGELYIAKMPWRDYLLQHPDTATKE